MNNGRHDKASPVPSVLPCTSENDSVMEVSPEGGEERVTFNTKTAVAKDTTDITTVLYKDDIQTGTRGDIIMFYNKIFIGFVKDYVLKFSPEEVQYMYMYIILIACYIICVYICICVCVRVRLV